MGKTEKEILTELKRRGYTEEQILLALDRLECYELIERTTPGEEPAQKQQQQ